MTERERLNLDKDLTSRSLPRLQGALKSRARIAPQGSPLVFRRVPLDRPPPLPHQLPWREAGPPDHHDDKVDSDSPLVLRRVAFDRARAALEHVHAVGLVHWHEKLRPPIILRLHLG